MHSTQSVMNKVDSYWLTAQGNVPRASQYQEWNKLTFLHWGYDPEIVAALLPGGFGLEPHPVKRTRLP